MDFLQYLPNIKPKYIAVKQMIMTMIEQDVLTVDSRLPSERQMAKLLKMNRSTIIRAFSELASDNILVQKMGSGTYINATSKTVRKKTHLSWQGMLENPRFSSRQLEASLLESTILEQNTNLINLLSSDLPNELIPKIQFTNLQWRDFIEAQKKQKVNGYLPLIKDIQLGHVNNNDIQVSEKEILITSGAKQALFLVLQGLLVPGDAIAVESPSFFNRLSLFEATGVKTYNVTLTSQGLDLKTLEQTILKHRIKLLLVNPNFQNPTGHTLALEQRQLLVKLCRQYQVTIIEDDVFGWLNFPETKPLPTLKSLDPDNVIYISSLSKIMGDIVKFGWIIAPKPIIEQLVIARDEMDVELDLLPQVMAHLLMQSATFEQQIYNLKNTLAQRSQFLERQLRQLNSNWSFEKPTGGYFLWLQNQEKGSFTKALLNQQIAIPSGQIFGGQTNTLRLNFARIAPDEVEQFGRQLVNILNQH